MGVQGAQRLGAPFRCSPEQAPWWLFGFFLAIQKEARRRGGETLQGTTDRARWLRKLRRSPEMAPKTNVADAGPSGPAGI